MTAYILLDREGDLPVPDGVQLIESEVDFLRLALAPPPLLIRGERLCVWAEAFYALRGQSVRVVESPRAVLRRAFPVLSSRQAQELSAKLGKEQISAEEVSPVTVLIACFPKDYVLWQSKPSLEHAARWLLWLLEHTPTEAESIILAKIASDLEQKAGDAPEAEFYRAANASQAKILLWRWLGAEKGSRPDWGEFPAELPAHWLSAIKEAWMTLIIEKRGSLFEELLSFPLPLALRQELAHLTSKYYCEHTYQLTHATLQQLQPYLDRQTLLALEERLPPPVPIPLPEDEFAVLDWFAREYLPYRSWQESFGDDQSRQISVQHAQTFARWLLERYSHWLLDGEHLAFQKSARLASAQPEFFTLCIILDGLPAWDAESLVKELSTRSPRLTLLQKLYCFTALPTVTEFAKEALLRGVPPRLAMESMALGKILPDNRSPKKHLDNIQPGQVYFWRVEQPDKAYHFENEDKRERQIRAELASILHEIEDVAQAIPNNLQLRILLTSDHGRLMNARSPRQLSISNNVQAHGRVAWGNIQHSFPENGFDVDENAGWVELYGERFGMAHNLRIAWGEESFKSRNGYESYPHGGLFPEEVIVPWFMFERDAKAPELKIRMTGEGEADMSGEVQVVILNNSPQALECHEVTFSNDRYNEKVATNWVVPPLSETHFEMSLTPWPPKSIEGKLPAVLIFSQPSGATFSQAITAELTVNLLYDRPDDLLKELDL